MVVFSHDFEDIVLLSLALLLPLKNLLLVCYSFVDTCVFLYKFLQVLVFLLQVLLLFSFSVFTVSLWWIWD